MDMFEMYTEKARRAIFFARYEASQYGRPEIDTACLLLGLLRENKDLMNRLLPAGSEELGRLVEEVRALFPESTEKIPTHVDLPLSHPARRALAYGAEESQRLAHKTIDPRHLLLGLLRENGPEVKGLNAHGIQLEKLRADFLREPLAEGSEARVRPGAVPEWVLALVGMLQEMPADRREAAVTLLKGLASGRFEATGTSRHGPFHFSFEETAE